MTKLEALIERARALPADQQDALAEEMETWLDLPSPPEGIGADGSDRELARRLTSWRACPAGIPTSDLHSRLRSLREEK